MNPKIKDLAIQASKETDSWDIPNKFIERFAHLIIRECAEVAYNASWESIQSLPDWNAAKNIISSETHYAIEKHFGIEE